MERARENKIYGYVEAKASKICLIIIGIITKSTPIARTFAQSLGIANQTVQTMHHDYDACSKYPYLSLLDVDSMS